MRVYDLANDRLVEEKVLGQRLLRWAYASFASPGWRRLLFQTGWPSRCLGWFCDRPLSRRRIAATVAELDIDLEEADVPPGGFRTFNQFFARRLKPGRRPFDPSPAALVSPADGRILAWPDDAAGGLAVPVKGLQLTVASLLQPPPAWTDRVAALAGGAVVVCRLCPADYHRYHFPAGGRRLGGWRLAGRYDSVNPLPLRLGVPVFAENVRQISLLELSGFGLCAFVEVGAFGVGRMVDTHRGDPFVKMEEKGFFEFGGSTIVLLFEPGRLAVAPCLAAWTAKGVETLVKAGTTIATRRDN